MCERPTPQFVIHEITSWQTNNGLKKRKQVLGTGEIRVVKWYPASPNIIDSKPTPARSIFIEASNQLTVFEHAYDGDPEHGYKNTSVALADEAINHYYDELITRTDPLGRRKSYAFLQVEDEPQDISS